MAGAAIPDVYAPPMPATTLGNMVKTFLQKILDITTSDPGRTGGEGRLFLEAVLWRARTGGPWRDLPPGFGDWNSVFERFRYWVEAGVFQRIFDALSDEPDMEFAMIDGTIIKVHRHGQGAKGGLKISP